MTSQHDSTQTQQQHQTVVASVANSMGLTHQVNQQQAQQQNQQGNLQPPASSASMAMASSACLPPIQHPQVSAAGIPNMTSLQSLPPAQHTQQISAADWGHGRVQLIQQPIQNPTYLQHLYNAQGQILMPSNIAIHPGINPQQIQVIAAGKPFPGGQLAPHMLATAQGKQVLQAGQTSSFSGYATIPTIPTTQNQTLVLSPLSVISSQPSLPAHTQVQTGIPGQSKNGEIHKTPVTGQKVQMQKVNTVGVGMNANNNNGQNGHQQQCVQVSQAVLGTQPSAQIINPLQAGGQAVQFAPWQLSGTLPHVWAGGIQTSQILAPNPIFIRGTGQPDGTTQSMFIQHSPQPSTATTLPTATNNSTLNLPCTMQTVQQPPGPTPPKPRPSVDNINSKGPRPLTNIVPSNIRPATTMTASSVSTQTGAGQLQNQVINKQGKPRGKPAIRASGPAATQKQDAANQTNKQPPAVKQPMLVMNSAGHMTTIPEPMTPEKAQQLNNKSIQQQQQQQQQQPVLIQQQHPQTVLQQQQQIIQQQPQFAQHYQHQAQQNQNQHLQAKSMIGMALPTMQQAGMPVVSMNQGMPVCTIPQPISMVQQLNPLTAMAAPPGTIIGQLAPTVPGSPSAALGASQQAQQMLTQSLASAQALTQNTLQVQNAAMVQPGQLIQTSVGLVQSNSLAGIAQQSGLSQNQITQHQIIDQQINSVAPNSMQSPQNLLQPPQNPIMQVPGAILSTQLSQNPMSSPQGMLHPPQNPLNVIGQQMQHLLSPTPNMQSAIAVAQPTIAIQQPSQTVSPSPQQQHQQISQLPQPQMQQTQQQQLSQQQQQPATVQPQQTVQLEQTQHLSNHIIPPVAAISSNNSMNTTLESVKTNESQKDTMTIPSQMQVNSPMQNTHHGSNLQHNVSTPTSSLKNLKMMSAPSDALVSTHNTVDTQKVATTAQENIVNSTSAQMSPMTTDQQTQPPHLVFNGSGQPPQSSVSVTSVSLKQEMTTSSLTSTYFSLQTQDVTVVSSTQNKPKLNSGVLNHLLLKASPSVSKASTTKPTQSKALQGKSSPMDKSLPQAKVRPNVLTHVIDGFVIQEAGEPFAVSKPLRNWSSEKQQEQENEKNVFNDNKRKRKSSFENNMVPSTSQDSPTEQEKCDFYDNEMKSIKKLSSNHNSRKGLSPKPSSLSSPSVASSISDCESSEGSKSSLKYENGVVTSNVPEEPQTSNPDTPSNSQPPSSTLQWGVSEVCDFVKNIPGCAIYADDFAVQEVDGEALVLIKPEHLVMAMAMKLGPALKIVASIDTLRPDKVLSKETGSSSDDIKRRDSFDNVSSSPKKAKYE